MTFYDKLEARLGNLMPAHISIPGITNLQRIALQQKINQCVDMILPLLSAEVDKDGNLPIEKYREIIREEVPRILDSAASLAVVQTAERKELERHLAEISDPHELAAIQRWKSREPVTNKEEERPTTADDVINAFEIIYGHVSTTADLVKIDDGVRNLGKN